MLVKDRSFFTSYCRCGGLSKILRVDGLERDLFHKLLLLWGLERNFTGCWGLKYFFHKLMPLWGLEKISCGVGAWTSWCRCGGLKENSWGVRAWKNCSPVDVIVGSLKEISRVVGASKMFHKLLLLGAWKIFHKMILLGLERADAIVGAPERLKPVLASQPYPQLLPYHHIPASSITTHFGRPYFFISGGQRPLVDTFAPQLGLRLLDAIKIN